MSKEIENDETFLFDGKELVKKFQWFPWKTFFESYGIQEWKKKTFRIKSTRWFHLLEKSFQRIQYNEWKKLFRLHLILHALPLLPPPYDTIDFEFFDNKLRGQKKKIPQRMLTLQLIKNYLTQPLSILYKAYYLKDSLKKNATIFIENIRKSAIEQLDTNTWLQDSTKKQAIEKVKDMILSIGWPTQYPTIILPTLQTDNMLENIYLLSASSTDKNILLLNKKGKPGAYWEEPTFLVNDFYYNEINEFIIPAASLFYPFYDANTNTLGWNYGGIGAVIGHEMVHAFDEDGRNFNEHGLYKPWWKAIDTLRFHARTKKLIDFYSHSKIQGRNINGTLTINENL
jgi:predicted metalloendopeptidase